MHQLCVKQSRIGLSQRRHLRLRGRGGLSFWEGVQRDYPSMLHRLLRHLPLQQRMLHRRVVRNRLHGKSRGDKLRSRFGSLYLRLHRRKPVPCANGVRLQDTTLHGELLAPRSAVQRRMLQRIDVRTGKHRCDLPRGHHHVDRVGGVPELRRWDDWWPLHRGQFLLRVRRLHDLVRVQGAGDVQIRELLLTEGCDRNEQPHRLLQRSHLEWRLRIGAAPNSV
ncbi:MAG: hypothetical protein NVSMB1_08740 [Polyangiales bacterium]